MTHFGHRLPGGLLQRNFVHLGYFGGAPFLI
jgi:hypothetical protein